MLYSIHDQLSARQDTDKPQSKAPSTEIITVPPKWFPTTRTVRVDVTQEDIDAPREHCSLVAHTCMVARAMNRATGERCGVGMLADGRYEAHMVDRVCHVSLPDWVQSQISSYDAILPVQPFSFDIEIPTEDICEGGTGI